MKLATSPVSGVPSVSVRPIAVTVMFVSIEIVSVSREVLSRMSVISTDSGKSPP